jgi:hypothetical protein
MQVHPYIALNRYGYGKHKFIWGGRDVECTPFYALCPIDITKRTTAKRVLSHGDQTHYQGDALVH